MRYLPLVVLLTALPAQEAFNAKQFLPNEYENIVRVNMKTLRDTGVWDELEAGLLKLFFGQMEQEAGFALESLDRLTVVPLTRKGDGGMSARQEQVLILEGNTELDIPNRVARNATYVDESIGIYDVKRRERFGDEVFFRPRPEVQIYGSTALLRPVLEGRPSAGMPCPDIMSLMAGRSDALVYGVLNLADETLNKRMVPTLFPDAEWPEGDGMKFLMFRVNAIGDPDDPNVELEVVIRHDTDGEGLAVTEKAVAARLDQAKKVPQLRLFAPLLKDVVQTRDRGDLTLKLDLGTGRTAAGRLSMLMAPMMMMGTTVEARPVPVGAPAAEAPKEKAADTKPAVPKPVKKPIKKKG